MGIKTVILLLSFSGCCIGTLYAPLVGVLGYVTHYLLWPDNQWWGQAVAVLNLRYAFTIGVFLIAGVVLRKHTLQLASRSMWGQEWLMIAMVVTVAISMISGYQNTAQHGSFDEQLQLLDKMAKVILFCLLLTHVVTTLARLDMLLWTLVLGTLYNAYRAWEAPVWRFTGSRLNGIGGPDFRESSFLGAHFAIMLPIIGMLYMRSGKVGKTVCVITGGLTVNGLILTQTRAAFVAVACGAVVAAVFAIRGYRRKILSLMIPGLAMAVFLMDDGFWQRMKTMLPAPALQPIVDVPPGHRQNAAVERLVRAEANSSAVARRLVWNVAYRMFLDHPLGAGVANFRPMAASYNPATARRDAHSTYLRCAAELGVPGLAVLLTMILNAYLYLHRARRLARFSPASVEVRWRAYALGTSICIMLVCGVFMSQTYIEEFWWFLAMPVCLLRAADNERLAGVAATAGVQASVETPGGIVDRHPGSPIPGLQPVRTFAHLGSRR